MSGRKHFRQFLRKPLREMTNVILYRWVQAFPRIPVPIRLPFGAWWLARNDFLGAALFCGGFEEIERSFVEYFLRPGMTVLDIGAHHGFYTLFCSRKVGAQGMVLAIEASPRERKRLDLHLRINRCKNVQVECCALAETEGSAELHVVIGGQTGCNSLQKPAVAEPTVTVAVHTRRLDDVVRAHHLEKVDFIKLDVEGSELSVLKGGWELLSRPHRPVILVEVQDTRTLPWGYRAQALVNCLSAIGYHWFRPLPGGRLERMSIDENEYDGNLVAIPEEHATSLVR